MKHLTRAIGYTLLLALPAAAQQNEGADMTAAPHEHGPGSWFCAADLMPWNEVGRLVLRAPETIFSSMGLLFIDHNRPDMPPIVKPDPWPRFGEPDADGAMVYDCLLPNRAAFHGSISPVADGYEVYFDVTNGAVDTISGLMTQFCLMQNEAPEFFDPLLERTFVFDGDGWVALKGTSGESVDEGVNWAIVNVQGQTPLEKTDPVTQWWVSSTVTPYGLIATRSEDGSRLVAIAFERPYKVMSNGALGCLHVDPELPDCPPGLTVGVRGKVYCMEGDLDALLTAYERDFR